MKAFLFFLLTLAFSFQLFAQVEVTNGKFPFNQIIEWPGKGTLLLGNDPTGRTVEINFNLFNSDGEVAWNRSVYPKSENTHLIVSGMSDYLYFVDDLELVNNNIRYNQVNQSGSIVPTKFDMLAVIRSYRYTTPSDLELKDIVNTPKALVFYFQMPVKDKGIIENFFVTITHHNNRVYHYQGPSSDMDLIKEGKQGSLLFAGADENSIYFSRYEHVEGKENVMFYPFSPKAEPISSNGAGLIGFSPIPSEISFISLNGSYYIEQGNKTKLQANGKGVLAGGKFYYAVNDSKDRCLKIYSENEKGEFVVVNECTNPADDSKKYQASISILPIGNKVIVIGSINGKSSAFELGSEKINPISIQSNNLSLIQKNPSSFKVENKSANFVHFIKGTPYYFDHSKLEKSEQVIFKQ